VGGRDHYKCGSCNLSHCPKNTKLVYRARHGTCKGQSNGNAHPPLLVQARAQYPEPMDRAEFMHLPAMRRQWPEAKPGVKGIKKQSQNKNDQLGTEKELCKSTARKKKFNSSARFCVSLMGARVQNKCSPPAFTRQCLAMRTTMVATLQNQSRRPDCTLCPRLAIDRRWASPSSITLAPTTERLVPMLGQGGGQSAC